MSSPLKLHLYIENKQKVTRIAEFYHRGCDTWRGNSLSRFRTNIQEDPTLDWDHQCLNCKELIYLPSETADHPRLIFRG